jgi:enoyl-CoA hydratase/carnithine racemase
VEPSAGISVRGHQDGALAEIVLSRPGSLNALSTALLAELERVLGRLAADGAVRAVVLSAAGDRAFCVGADLKERAAMSDAQLLAQRPAFRAAFGALLGLPQPVIAAVHGFALGGGCELALSCDLIVADETAIFGLPEVTVGLVPGCGGTQLTTRRLGQGVAADLVLTGRKVDAAEAARIGLADRVVPAGTAGQSALELAGQIAANSPVAVRAAKRAIRLGSGLGLAAGLDVEDAAWRTAALSDDRREGIAAFAARRPPAWPGPAPSPPRTPEGNLARD